PQSHRPEPNTSPVRHWEWIRTSAESCDCGLSITSAKTPSVLSPDSKPVIWNVPYGVGRRVAATLVAFMRLDYITVLRAGWSRTPRRRQWRGGHPDLEKPAGMWMAP